MRPPRLPPAAVRPSIALAGRWALSPRVDWPTRRRRVDAAQAWPGPPRGTAVTARTLGGVACEQLTPAGAAGDALLVFLHGGGYCVGSPRSHRALVGRMAQGFGAPGLAVDYRLAPEHPHPAALQDALAVWDALTEGAQAIAPARIVVAGDSAGGGLALALALSLRDAGRPQPAALGLISPWLDLVADTANVRPPAPGDVLLSRGLLRAFAAAYLSGGASPRDPLVSPAHADPVSLAPLVIHTAGEELIRSDGLDFARRARDAGVAVTAEELPGLWHDVHLAAETLTEPAGGAPLRMAAALRAHVPARP
ncbi:MAG TPA: alpha/beta hydrolase [Solirubrobacteraceae bacterium]|nr:alpha/beta hydrolase [Solirubrobacteraceae bacterium]